MGEAILLRLRPHFDPDAFLPEDDIVHTMLHEVIPLYRLPLSLISHIMPSSVPVDPHRARPP
jgi:hypothetical protein